MLRLGILSILAGIILIGLIVYIEKNAQLDPMARVALEGQVYYQFGYDDYQNSKPTYIWSAGGIAENDLDRALFTYFEKMYQGGYEDAKKGIPSKAKKIQESRRAILETIESIRQRK